MSTSQSSENNYQTISEQQNTYTPFIGENSISSNPTNEEATKIETVEVKEETAPAESTESPTTVVETSAEPPKVEEAQKTEEQPPQATVSEAPAEGGNLTTVEQVISQ